jgi:hypothetical protein
MGGVRIIWHNYLLPFLLWTELLPEQKAARDGGQKDNKQTCKGEKMGRRGDLFYYLAPS